VQLPVSLGRGNYFKQTLTAL